jgi:hypothetical protein
LGWAFHNCLTFAEGLHVTVDPLNRSPAQPVEHMAGAGLPTKEEVVLVIACAGVIGWLLMLGITLCLGAAAKRGDELELDAQRYLPPYCVDDAKIIPFDRANKTYEQQPSQTPFAENSFVICWLI